MSKEKRAVANNEEVGKLRYETYQKSISRIKSSIENGYFLEAITLCESLISDRLESRLNFITSSHAYSFKPLGTLQHAMLEFETDAELLKLMEKKKGALDLWRDSRNNALHAMAKIADGDNTDWDAKMGDCKNIAIQGEVLRKDIFKLTDRRIK